MELDWTTFLLEIVNFLILVWILKRFLYKPVMTMIDQRRASIQKKVDEASALHTEAESLKSRYQERLTQWEDEKNNLRNTLHKEIETERKQLMEQLGESLEAEKKKAQILIERRANEEFINKEKLAIQQGTLFCSRLLARLAGPELENAIVQLFLEELDKLSAEQQQLLKTTCKNDTTPAKIFSAYELSIANREHIENALHRTIAGGIQVEYRQDASLISGLCIQIGSRYLGANLRDELKFFGESVHAFD